jgi:rSAM/selenodomain-associated transferase 1
MKRALVVVAKRPMPGETKTRLCPPLEPDQASELYRSFLLDTLDLMAGLDGAKRMIAYTPRGAEGYFRQIAPHGFALITQEGENLGQRLSNVVDVCLNMGYAQVVVMNSDGPTLPAAHLQQAFELLDCPKVDVVLGPSDDGGYYLIGLKRSCPALFQVAMSTPTVLRETLWRADELGLQAKCLPGWYDVDTPSDLQRLVRELPSLPYQVAVRTRQLLACWPGAGRFPEAWSASPLGEGRSTDST